MENPKHGQTSESNWADRTRKEESTNKSEEKTTDQINPNQNDDDFNTDSNGAKNRSDQNRNPDDSFENDANSNQRDRTKFEDDSNYPASRRDENRKDSNEKIQIIILLKPTEMRIGKIKMMSLTEASMKMRMNIC